jgi:cell wall-associated NlpC family hydrolase
VLYRGSLLPSDFINGFSLGPTNFHPKEVNFALNRNHSVIEIAQSYLNTPYLWGGRSATGIDCSGFTQMVFSFLGKSLPRDASQQIGIGSSVLFSDAQAGDLAFFQNNSGKIIHVGILTGQGTILHAHGTITEDYMKTDGIYKKQDLVKSHELHSIKRI